MSKPEKKNKKYGKKLNSVSDTLEFFNDISQILTPLLLVSTIFLAPFGLIGTIFSALLIVNFFAFSFMSAPWMGQFKDAAKEMVEADKEYDKTISPLKEKLAFINEEKAAAKKQIEEGEKRIDEMLQKAQDLKQEAKKRQKKYDNLSELVKASKSFAKNDVKGSLSLENIPAFKVQTKENKENNMAPPSDKSMDL